MENSWKVTLAFGCVLIVMFAWQSGIFDIQHKNTVRILPRTENSFYLNIDGTWYIVENRNGSLYVNDEPFSEWQLQWQK